MCTHRPAPSPLTVVCLCFAREVLNIQEPVSLAKLWDQHVNQMDSTHNGAHSEVCCAVVNVLSQAYQYMSERGHKYGGLTTYEYTWLFCCEEDGVLQVSRGFGRQATGPTAREVSGNWAGTQRVVSD